MLIQHKKKKTVNLKARMTWQNSNCISLVKLVSLRTFYNVKDKGTKIQNLLCKTTLSKD